MFCEIKRSNNLYDIWEFIGKISMEYEKVCSTRFPIEFISFENIKNFWFRSNDSIIEKKLNPCMECFWHFCSGESFQKRKVWDDFEFLFLYSPEFHTFETNFDIWDNDLFWLFIDTMKSVGNIFSLKKSTLIFSRIEPRPMIRDMSQCGYMLVIGCIDRKIDRSKNIMVVIMSDESFSPPTSWSMWNNQILVRLLYLWVKYEVCESIMRKVRRVELSPRFSNEFCISHEWMEFAYINNYVHRVSFWQKSLECRDK